MIRWVVAAIGFCIAATPVLAADPIEIGIGYLGRAGVKAKLSLVELPAENDGLAGARLAVEDNNTTGKFLNQHFTLEEVRLKDNEDVAKAAAALAATGLETNHQVGRGRVGAEGDRGPCGASTAQPR